MLLSALFAGLCAFLAASVCCWAALARRVTAGRPLLAQEPMLVAPWGFADLLVTVVFLSLFELLALTVVRTQYGIEPGSSLAGSDVRMRAALLSANSLAQLAAMVISVVWLALRYRLQPRDMGWGIGPPLGDTHSVPSVDAHSVPAERLCGPPGRLVAALRRDFSLGAVAFVGVAPVVFGIQWLLSQFLESHHPVLELLKENPDPRFFAVSIFSAVLVAPVVEEYVFRVLLQGWMERFCTPVLEPLRIVLGGPAEVVTPNSLHGYAGAEQRIAEFDGLVRDGRAEGLESPTWLPILTSSALFALMHLSHGPAPIPLFLFAVVLGYMYARTRRVWPCIVTHALLNAVSLSVLWLAVRFDLQ